MKLHTTYYKLLTTIRRLRRITVPKTLTTYYMLHTTNKVRHTLFLVSLCFLLIVTPTLFILTRFTQLVRQGRMIAGLRVLSLRTVLAGIFGKKSCLVLTKPNLTNLLV